MSGRALWSELERAVDPPSAEEQSVLEALDAHLDRTLPPGRGPELERAGEFPDEAMRAFASEGFVRHLVPAKEGGSLDWSFAMRIGTRLAAHDVDFALCLGGAVLGGMPLLVVGNDAQRARYFGELLRGEMGALALSEWAHGSDLLSIDARAEPRDREGMACAAKDAVSYRLFGEKAPVNNASRGAYVVVLARTGAIGDPFGASLFLVEQGAPGVSALPRFETIGFRSMDLSGLALQAAEVSRAMLLGNPGEGFTYARRSLEVSRSGVAAMSLGAHCQTLALALEHARTRVLYGKPIASLEAVQAILGRVYARLVESAALVRRAVRSAARWPSSARAWTAAAKLVAPALLEESVHDAGTLLGARSLLENLPLARLRRTAPVFAIFDGSSQLQLDELWRYAARWPLEATMDEAEARERIAEIRKPAPCPFDASTEDRDGILDRTSPPLLLRALAPALPGLDLDVLADSARLIARAAREGRTLGQSLRFRVSAAAASLYALSALVESTAAAGSAPALRSALAVRLAEFAPRLATTLLALEPTLGAAAAHEASSRVLPLSRLDDVRTAATHAAALP